MRQLSATFVCLLSWHLHGACRVCHVLSPLKDVACNLLVEQFAAKQFAEATNALGKALELQPGNAEIIEALVFAKSQM